MGRNSDDIIKSLPAERQAKIVALSQKMVEEMMVEAKTLADFRKALGKTQVEVAKILGIKQNAVSQLEKRSDTYVSTLRKFLQSLGMKLELSVVAQNGARFDLPNFLPWQEGISMPGEPNALAMAGARTAANSGFAHSHKVAARATASKKTATVSKTGSGASKKTASAGRKHSTAMEKT